MFHPSTRPILAALFVAGCFVTAAHAGAEQKPPSIPAPGVWTEPPEAVRTAATALRTACATWTQEASRLDNFNPGDAQRGRPAEVIVCQAAINPEAARFAEEMSFIVLAAAVVGLALASFTAVVFVLRFFAMWMRFGAEAANDAWPSFRRRYR